MAAFLTDDWFATVEKLTAEAGDLNLPPALAGLAINLVVSDASGDTELALDILQDILKKLSLDIKNIESIQILWQI